MHARTTTVTITKPQSAWHIILPVGAGTAFSLMGDTTMYAVLPTHLAQAGVLLASVGILLSANRFVRLAANSGVGLIVDRWAPRTVFVLALCFGAVSTALYAVVRGFWPLLLARLLWGISWSGIWIAGNKLVLDAAGHGRRGRWVARYHLIYFLGTGVSALIGGALTDWLGYRDAMAIGAAIQAAGVAIAWLFLPAPSKASQHEGQDMAIDESGQVEHKRRPARTPDLQQPRLLLTELGATSGLLGTTRFLIAGVWVSTLSLFLAQAVGEQVALLGQQVGVATLTGAGLAATTFLSMLFMPLIVGFSDHGSSRWWYALAGMVAGSAGYLLLALGAASAIFLGLPLLALANSSGQGISTALAGDLTRKTGRGRFLGVLYTVGDLGGAAGPPLAFALVPLWGTQLLYFLGAAVFACMLLVSLQRALKDRQRLAEAARK